VSALVGLVEVDDLVIGALRPTAGNLIVLARKDGDGCRDGDVDRIVEIEFRAFPIEAGG
jgi:hypothetical protein